MTLEQLLFCLRQKQSEISRHLNKADRTKLINFIQSACKTQKIETEFEDFCIDCLSDFIDPDSCRFLPGDEDELTESKVGKLSNEIVEALEIDEKDLPLVSDDNNKENS